MINLISNTIRGLSIDAINAANSGHPGLPLGCADIISVLYTKHLKCNPKNPHWINRDRFVLSAGHGSMLQYAILHLSGYKLSLDDLKNFRQIHSITAGHPEYDLNYGIETTTGPLGQGIGHAVGLALSEKIASARLNTEKHKLINHTIYCLAGDGCLMEGVASEASSLAGHLQLDNLVLIYDSNDICLDGPTSECFTENVEERYKAYGWETLNINGHDHKEIDLALSQAKTHKKPTLIIAKTSIGFGSPNRAGSSEAHGKPLGSDETMLTKKALNIPTSPKFHVPEEVSSYFERLQTSYADYESTWQTLYQSWQEENPDNKKLLTDLQNKILPRNLNELITNTQVKPNVASRSSSQAIIQSISDILPYIIGGSADLSCSDSTYIKKSSFINKTDFTQQNIKYGVREFAMSTIAAGLSLGGFFRPFIGTFMTFSDYMKNGIRLAALMNLPIIYQFTHDSIYLGEDGPTHQPIEHLASLRSIPNLNVIRPADTKEVKGAWLSALQSKQPTALVLSRQSLPDLEHSSIENTDKGAYIIKHESNLVDIQILASGSEVKLALEVATKLEAEGHSTRVVSFPSWERFDAQDKTYQEQILYQNAGHNVVIEAQRKFGWHQYSGRNATFITVETYGLSAPAYDIANEFGFTPEAIVKKVKTALPKHSHS